MKLPLRLPVLAFLFTLTQCKEERIDEDVYRIIHNASDYSVEVVVIANQDTLRETLAPGDSLINQGMCYSGVSSFCDFEWGFSDSNLDAAVIQFVFPGARSLFYESQPCNGTRNPAGGVDISPNYCGFDIETLNGLTAFVYDITNEDYEAAEPIEE